MMLIVLAALCDSPVVCPLKLRKMPGGLGLKRGVYGPLLSCKDLHILGEVKKLE